MTHLALIATALLLFLGDELAAFNAPAAWRSLATHFASAPALAALVLGPKLTAAAWFLWRGQAAANRLGGAATGRALRAARRHAVVLPLVATALLGIDLFALGLLPRIRAAVGNPVLLDELLAWAPTLALLLAGHAARYPVERRLRESELIRRADRGLPLHPVPGRAAWVAARTRQDLGLLLLPLILLMAWGEAVVQLTDAGTLGPTLGLALGPAGALGLLIVAPLILRHALDTVPLPPGPLGDALRAQCVAQGVRVRQLLLWRTHGTALNAAVTGLVSPLRYILLTDALVEELDPPQLHAVMEHELNHARHRHLPTLMLVAAALLVALAAGGEAAAQTLAPLLVPWLPAGRSPWVDGLLAAAGLGLAALAFGWASRRIERQADTPRAQGPADHRYTADDVEPMLTALGQVATRSHLDPHRFSWRHGSIHWRQSYLRGLVGTPVATAPIHQVVRRIRQAAVLLLTAGAAALWFLEV